MLRKITTGVFNSSSKRQKTKLASKGHINKINNTINSKEKINEKKDNKTPLYSPRSNIKSIKDNNFYSVTEKNIQDKKNATKRSSPKKSDINYSIESRRVNSKKYDTNNKSYFKEKKKSKVKSKIKYKVYNSKEKNEYKTSFIQNNNRNNLMFQKSESKINEQSFSPKKFVNNNWSFNDIS